MEFLKDVFTPFYERIKRPFIGAFWISVILTNWKVWVALFFYGEKVGSENKITYVNDLLKTETLICTPLLYTILFLIIGQLLDVLAFWWQLCVKRMKNYLKHKSNSGMMVDGQTFNRISQQLNNVKVENTQKTKKISDLEEIILAEKQNYSKLKKLSLEPSINYFLGQWKISNPNLPNIEITFNKVSTTQFEGEIKMKLNDKEIQSVNFLPLKMSKESIILPVLNIEDGNIFGEIINSHPKNTDVDFFLKLFKNETVFWSINHGSESTRKNEFIIRANDQGAPVILHRINSYNDYNKLWLNDEFALTD
jgi:hypothetical protein